MMLRVADDLDQRSGLIFRPAFRSCCMLQDLIMARDRAELLWDWGIDIQIGGTCSSSKRSAGNRGADFGSASWTASGCTVAKCKSVHIRISVAA
jgi:hypothetical protein